ncbi:MAG: hypothetical protein M0P38_07125 [Bacteroidales bacterium]|jgi:carbon monoxide dehydrogenase subunit G|nr:hypothetical protein [Bacteroidales bacterium]
MIIQNQTEGIHSGADKIYATLGNFQILEKMMPEQVQNWKATDEHCEFTVSGMASFQMDIVEKVADSKIVFRMTNDKNIPILLSFDINKTGETCRLDVTIDAEVPLFLQSVIKNPLQKVADTLGEKIKNYTEQQ